MSNAPAAYGMNDYSPSQYPNNQQPYYASRQTPPRTPSPTPSDIEELHKPVVDFKAVLNPKKYLKRKNIPWIIGITLLLTLVALLSIYHKQIVDWLTPFSNKLRDLPGGWAIPIGILFVISFPPLFGHEIVAVLCGVVWGLWVGFGIVAAGTFLGELGNYYAFKYICTAKGRKLEKDNLSYASLAYIVRQGGFLIALVARFSAIPGHFTTAVFSTCGINVFVFSLAAILSLPKQLTTVYLGVIIKETADGPEPLKSRIISDTVLAVSFLVTIVAAYWIYYQMAKAKPEVLRERRRARARKEWEMGGGSYGQSAQHLTSTLASRADLDSQSVFNPNDSEEEGYRPTGNTPYGAIPNSSEYTLGVPVSVQPQRWDAYGRAVPVLETGARRQDSADVVSWDPRRDGGTTVPPQNAYPGLPPAHPAVPYPPTSQTQRQQSPPVSYPPPGGPPPQAQPQPQYQYHDPYEQSYQSPQPPAPRVAPSPPTSGGGSTPYYSPPSQSSPPISAPISAPAPPQQPAIPASVPRFQLHDGPAPSVMSDAPTYRTYDPHPQSPPQSQPQPESPLPPRIPPPPGPSQPSPQI